MTREAGTAHRAPEAAVFASVLLLLLFVASVFFSHRILARRTSTIEGQQGRESLLLAISRRPTFAFGFRNVLADAAWLEAVQVAGTRVMASGDYDRLASLIEAVVNFDPKFEVPYMMGGIVLSDSPAHVPDALKVLARGKTELPSLWRIPLYEGYILYFHKGDPLAGGMALEAASRIPGSPPYLPLLASRMYAEGRRPETALQFLGSMARNETDPARLKTFENRMRDVETERDILELESAVQRFRETQGVLPETLSDLVTAGIVERIPREPRGGKYHLAPDGSVLSNRLAHRLKVLRPHAAR
jgi:hypothetical protein